VTPVEQDGVRLHHRDTGAGRPVLLLVHGWGGDSRAWTPLRFPGHRVVAMDLRGHGRSPVPPGGYRPADLAGDLAALIDRLGLAPVVAVGHSMGAQVVTVLAVEHPALVTSLVVIDPAYGADDAEARGFQTRLRELRDDGAAAAVRQLGVVPPTVRDQLLATPGPVLAACYAGMYTGPQAFGALRPAESYLRRRTHPVLCLRSLPEPARWEASVPAPPGSRVVVWPGTSHFLHLERPAETAALITEWANTPTRPA
jgi:pimeloyl-ACP methyl ester carboxylesterase